MVSEPDFSSDRNVPVDPDTRTRRDDQEEVPSRQTEINDAGHLVNSDTGEKVFTTTEEALKDGSLKLDSQGRMPGLYLEDIERVERENLSEQLAKINKESAHQPEVLKDVNIRNSPLPPVTTQTNPNPSQTQVDEVNREATATS